MCCLFMIVNFNMPRLLSVTHVQCALSVWGGGGQPLQGQCCCLQVCYLIFIAEDEDWATGSSYGSLTGGCSYLIRASDADHSLMWAQTDCSRMIPYICQRRTLPQYSEYISCTRTYTGIAHYCDVIVMPVCFCISCYR